MSGGQPDGVQRHAARLLELAGLAVNLPYASEPAIAAEDEFTGLAQRLMTTPQRREWSAYSFKATTHERIAWALELFGLPVPPKPEDRLDADDDTCDLDDMDEDGQPINPPDPRT